MAEWHITVDHRGFDDVIRWSAFCASHGVKPIWIELNDFRRQLMCAGGKNISLEAHRKGWEVIRAKHEVEPHGVAIKNAVYYECHVKFDGPFKPLLPMASRDLLRAERWYMTYRVPLPFDYVAFIDEACACNPDCVFAGYEYEACVLDTNTKLDKGWR